MLVAGTLTYKMGEALRRLYDQMAEPKWVIAMGACSSSAGMFRTYSVMQGIDHLVPVDYYIPGCPPRPEMLLMTLLELQRRIAEEPAHTRLRAAPRREAPAPAGARR
jgi:NADH-quinone oxidoreductase subunit B